ncbi:MAG: hypothetical protein HQL52_03590 [Magnetococcales bacterium]|nr:hypothetical protein [Magnetococcales bacterium]
MLGKQPSKGRWDRIRDPQAGMISLKTLVILVVIVWIVMVGGTLVPAAYEYHILRELADRVAGDYSDLTDKEVRQRIEYELNRSRMKLDEGTFVYKKLRRNQGYKVNIDFRVDMHFNVAGFVIPMGQYEELQWTYEVETPQ